MSDSPGLATTEGTRALHTSPVACPPTTRSPSSVHQSPPSIEPIKSSPDTSTLAQQDSNATATTTTRVNDVSSSTSTALVGLNALTQVMTTAFSESTRQVGAEMEPFSAAQCSPTRSQPGVAPPSRVDQSDNRQPGFRSSTYQLPNLYTNSPPYARAQQQAPQIASFQPRQQQQQNWHNPVHYGQYGYYEARYPHTAGTYYRQEDYRYYSNPAQPFTSRVRPYPFDDDDEGQRVRPATQRTRYDSSVQTSQQNNEYDGLEEQPEQSSTVPPPYQSAGSAASGSSSGRQGTSSAATTPMTIVETSVTSPSVSSSRPVGRRRTAKRDDAYDIPSTPGIKPFVQKLRYMLNRPADFGDVVTWDSTGTRVIIDTEASRLSSEVLPRVYGHQNPASFQKQFTSYGFTLTKPSPEQPISFPLLSLEPPLSSSNTCWRVYARSSNDPVTFTRAMINDEEALKLVVPKAKGSSSGACGSSSSNSRKSSIQGHGPVQMNPSNAMQSTGAGSHTLVHAALGPIGGGRGSMSASILMGFTVGEEDLSPDDDEAGSTVGPGV